MKSNKDPRYNDPMSEYEEVKSPYPDYRAVDYTIWTAEELVEPSPFSSQMRGHCMWGDHRSPEKLDAIQKCPSGKLQDAGLVRKSGVKSISGINSVQVVLHNPKIKPIKKEPQAFFTYTKKIDDDKTSTKPDSFRKCQIYGLLDQEETLFKCSNIFVRSKLDDTTKEALVSAHLTRFERHLTRAKR